MNEMPAHTHVPAASTVTPTTGVPTGADWTTETANFYAPTASGAMSPAAIGNFGGSQPHNNMQPYLVINFLIALQGIFPSRN